MANYWNYPTSTTGYWPSTTSSGGTVPYYGTQAPHWYSGTNATGTNAFTRSIYVTYVVREYVVSLPDHYSTGDIADLVYLINDATKTGFTVKFVFNDDSVQITDPSIEKRKLEDFIPLLLRAATADDQKIINDFFVAHPLVPPSVDTPES